ncbi:phage virion morphogenesis protein [Achromobacter sp. UMC71]|uniref:phage virion morphogenesis protein n=1 Tax=Achromobacter sp. UMC71 TaxID=1862320 RepID=UPI0015FF7497|nr:phage virion morphogenesis protein [Achromobacter sp. UMC71]MBB1625179.1 phage virion morphogenesis protein [Achromobacter sp. UMC71]
MSDPLTQVEDWAAALLARLSPAEQRKVNAKVGQALRRNQMQRIAAQRNPDGTAYAPRRVRKNLRGKKGRIKRRAMFTKLRTTRHLRVQAAADGVTVGFFGRVARIARVHQRGLNDRPAAGMADVRYAQRELLGFTQPDIELIRDTLAEHLAGPSLS